MHRIGTLEAELDFLTGLKERQHGLPVGLCARLGDDVHDGVVGKLRQSLGVDQFPGLGCKGLCWLLVELLGQRELDDRHSRSTLTQCIDIE